MTSHDQHKVEKIIIQDINHLSDEEQALKLAEHFSEIPNSYDQIKKEDIKVETFEKSEIPQIKEVQVWDLLTQLRTNKSTVREDLPATIYKDLASYISEPLTHVFNASLIQGENPMIYKFEISTPRSQMLSS